MKSPENTLTSLFTDHPASVGETYLEHVGVALSFASALFAASLCCLVHAFLPFLFEKTGSGFVRSLYERMVTSRSKLPSQEALGSEWSDYSL